MRQGMSRAILDALKVGGILAMTILAPNAIQCLKGGGNRKGRKNYAAQFQKSLYYLNRQKLIGLGRKNGKDTVYLTEKGRQKINEYEHNQLRIPAPRSWDKKWRVVAFDIPKQFKNRSDIFRKKLKSLNFFMLQKSLWVYPYECAEQIEYLRDLYEIRPFVRMLLAERLDSSKSLRQHFSI
ncbi:MAG: hypothetical protein AAB871_03185 [Patescibacteria group bacterium]